MSAVAKLPAPEVIVGLAHDAYAKIDAEHSGVLQRILTSPLAYRHAKDQELAGIDEDRDALRLGRAVHTAVLEPHRLASQYVCWSGGRRGGNAWDAFTAETVAKGQTILKEDQLDLAVAIAKSVRGHPIAGPLLKVEGRAELTIVWTHPRTGVRIKCRLDRIAPGILLDLKTTRDVSPGRFCTQAAQLGYHTQLAMYADSVYAAKLGPVDTKIVAVQSATPHDVVVYALDEGVLGPGRERYETALDLLVSCRKSGKWPGQAVDAEVPMRLPAWASPSELELTFDGEAIA